MNNLTTQSKKINRVIVVQGPAQLITAISVLKAVSIDCPSSNFQDYLILGGFATSVAASQELIDICLDIAKIWKFEKIISLANIEKLYRKKFCSFTKSTKICRKILPIEQVHEIYVAFNWQFINELLLAAYPEADGICYGDALGKIDISTETLVKNPSSLIQSQCNPKGFKKIKHVVTVAPYGEENVINNYKVDVIDPRHYFETVRSTSEMIGGLSSYCKQVTYAAADKITIVLTSNLTEASLVKSLNKEIELYMSCVLKYTKEEDCILIKGHPRETLSQSHTLAKMLRERNRTAEVVSEFSRVPVEIFAAKLSLSKAITFNSGSCTSLALISQCDVIVGFGERAVRKYITKKNQNRLLLYEKIYVKQVQEAMRGYFSPLAYSINTLSSESSNFSDSPVLIPSVLLNKKIGQRQPSIERKETTIEYETSFERLPSDFKYKIFIFYYIPRFLTYLPIGFLKKVKYLIRDFVVDMN